MSKPTEQPASVAAGIMWPAIGLAHLLGAGLLFHLLVYRVPLVMSAMAQRDIDLDVELKLLLQASMACARYWYLMLAGLAFVEGVGLAACAATGSVRLMAVWACGGLVVGSVMLWWVGSVLCEAGSLLGAASPA